MVKLPGATRTRSIVPGDAVPQPSGAVYHGSSDGGIGVDEMLVGSARATVANEDMRIKNEATLG